MVLNQAVQNLNTVDGVRRAADQLRPEVSGATDQIVLNALAGTHGTIEQRTQSLRFQSLGLSGVSAGDDRPDRGVGLWVQGFGTSGSQSERNGFSGFDVRTAGAAVGSDVEVAEGLRLGLAFSYARGTVKESGHRSDDRQTVNSYIGSLYGSYNHEMFYVDAVVSGGRHNYEQTRVVSIDTFTGTASADYGADQYGGKIEAGMPIAVAERVFVTPLANIAHNRLSIDGYTETGAAGANLAVSGRTVSSTRVGVGASVAAELGGTGGVGFTPTARVLYTRELGDRDYNTTVRFAEGTQTFTVAGAPLERNALQLGIGMDFKAASGVTLTAAYDAELRKGYTGHSGLLRLRLDF